VPAVAANDDRQRHPEPALEQVCNRRHPAIEKDVAGFGQGFIFEIDDIFQRQLPPTTARTSSRLLASGKIRSARPAKAPLKSWRTATRFGLSGFATS
jgi:hypothetical protein